MARRARRDDDWRQSETRVAMTTAVATTTTAVAKREARAPRAGVSLSRVVRRESTSDADAPRASGTFDATDARYMRRALELAATATAAEVFPNPLVGCVVVDARTDEVVGEGYHPKAGEPHAEVFALRAAGARARGAAAYVLAIGMI